LTTLEDLQYESREELIQIWKKLFKINSPQHSRKEFLIKHISWEMQAKEKGGFSKQTKQKLDKLSAKVSEIKAFQEESSKIIRESALLEIKAGTKLIREYKGEKHEVISLDKGFEYRNRTYKSLSAIANDITGTKWNGKVFFGIKK
jgi:hypothetical protein